MGELQCPNCSAEVPKRKGVISAHPCPGCREILWVNSHAAILPSPQLLRRLAETMSVSPDELRSRRDAIFLPGMDSLDAIALLLELENEMTTP